MLIVKKDKCTGDELCTTVCPTEAAHMVDGKAEIDVGECIECYACQGVCPHDAIEEVDD